MAFVPKTWIDRASEHPNRRTLTNVNDSSDVKTYDITRAEGNVTQAGSIFNATALNELEGRITAMNTSLFGTISTITLPATGTGSWDSTTHLITVAVTGVTTVSNQEIFGLPATSQANIENNELLQQANIMDAGQTTGYITLYAENIPTVDLQIRVLVRT